MTTLLWVVLGLIILAGLWAMGLFNRLISMKNQVRNAWKQIDVQLQRRFDLIPNLVESVKGYMKHERETLESVIQARQQGLELRKKVMEAGGPTEESLAELAKIDETLRRGTLQIFALSENYPELRATENMQQLQEELTTTENRIAFSRQSYNDTAMRYNTAQQVFPANLLAETFGHHAVDLFSVEEEGAKKPVKVEF